MSEVKYLSAIPKGSAAAGDTLLGLDNAGNPKQIPVGGVAKSGVFYVNAGKKMAFHVPALGYTSFMAGFSNAQRQVYGWLGGYDSEAMRWNLSLSCSSHNIFKAAYATTKSCIFVLEALADKSLNVVFNSSEVITAEPYDEATHGALQQIEPKFCGG